MPRLIWVFAGRTLTLLVLSCRGSNSVWLSWMSLCLSRNPIKCWLSCFSKIFETVGTMDIGRQFGGGGGGGGGDQFYHHLYELAKRLRAIWDGKVPVSTCLLMSVAIDGDRMLAAILVTLCPSPSIDASSLLINDKTWSLVINRILKYVFSGILLLSKSFKFINFECPHFIDVFV